MPITLFVAVCFFHRCHLGQQFLSSYIIKNNNHSFAVILEHNALTEFSMIDRISRFKIFFWLGTLFLGKSESRRRS